MIAARLAVVVCFAILLAARPMRAADDALRSKASAGILLGTDQFRHRGWHSRVFLTDGGKTLVVVSEGLVVRWWELATGKKLDEINLSGGLHDSAFAPDADLLAVAGVQYPAGDARPGPVLWLIDVNARKLVRTVKLPERRGGNSQKVRISADGKRVFVEQEGDLQVLDGKTGDELIRHKGRINAGALAASRDGKLVAFGRFDVFLWRWETGEEPKKFTNISNFGTELLEFSPDGKTLCIVPHSAMITTWDVATGTQTGSKTLRFMTRSMVFSPDGKALAVASSPNATKPSEGGHAIDLLDAATWTEVGRLPLGRHGVSHVAWSKDGARLAGVSDHRVWAWDVKSGKLLGPTRPGHDAVIVAMTFGPDSTLFTASDDHTIRSWNTATGAPGLELVHDYWVRDLVVSSDGALVAGSSLRNDLRVWDAKTGKQRFRLLGNGMMGGKRRVRFTPDGQRLVAWGDDQFVRVWDVGNGKLLSEQSTRPPGMKSDPDDPLGDRMAFMEAGFEAADLSPDGSVLALAGRNGIRIFDAATGKERQNLNVDAPPQAIAFSPDSKRLALAYRGKPVQTKLPDGRTRHSTEKDYPVALVDLASGKPVWTATAEGSWPRLAYSPDGSRVAVLSNVFQGPSRIWLWDTATGKETGRLELSRRGHQLAFDQTGKRLAVSFEDTTALVYELEAAARGASSKPGGSQP